MVMNGNALSSARMQKFFSEKLTEKTITTEFSEDTENETKPGFSEISVPPVVLKTVKARFCAKLLPVHRPARIYGILPAF